MPGTFQSGPIEGLVIIKTQRFLDGRGWFQEGYKYSEFAAAGIDECFSQDNVSCSMRGVLRGLHFQTGAMAQGKLVSVLRGAVWGVAVDLRRGSPTRGQWFGLELTEDNAMLFYVPQGFAHGFVALADNTIFTYKCTAEYCRSAERGIRWDDPELAIAWPLSEVIVSEKDKNLPYYKDLVL